MDNIRSEMLFRWNTDGWNYDAINAHGINDENERKEWMDLCSSLPKGTQVLDLGTGTGFVALIAAEMGLDVTGFDWSETMLKQANDKAVAKNLSIQFQQGALENLPGVKDSFDVITARHLLWTLVEPISIFRQWYRILRPGGKVFADYSPRKGMGHLGHHYSEETEKQLPLNRDISAVEIQSFFTEAGFPEVSYVSGKKEINHGDHTHINDVFMFTGVKK
jgi:ubiquinone/menaquinone biosynthesis C-methylase UbiE